MIKLIQNSTNSFKNLQKKRNIKNESNNHYNSKEIIIYNIIFVINRNSIIKIMIMIMIVIIIIIIIITIIIIIIFNYNNNSINNNSHNNKHNNNIIK